jgi:hypothetical protein
MAVPQIWIPFGQDETKGPLQGTLVDGETEIKAAACGGANRNQLLLNM